MTVAAVFDIDGTLVTFTFDVKGTRQALLDEVKKRGMDTAGLDLTTPTQRILDSAVDQMARGTASGDPSELRSSFNAILDSFEVESAKLAQVFPGARAALELLKSKGVRLAVLTNSGRRAADVALRNDDLASFFEFVLTRDDIDAMKPRPEGLLKAVSMLGLPKDSVYYVGDSLFDIIAAKLAGVKVVSVATGNYTAEKLRGEGADFVLGSLSEMGSLPGV